MMLLFEIVVAILFSIYSFFVIYAIIKNKLPKRDIIIPIFLEVLIILVFFTKETYYYAFAPLISLEIYVDMFVKNKKHNKKNG